MKFGTHRIKICALAGVALLLSAFSAPGYEVGTLLPRPDQARGGLVQPKRFTLKPVTLPAETRIVVFFYSASWCAPCHQVGAALRKTYARFRAAAPHLQVITYALDQRPTTRAHHLRQETYPWPALGPSLIDREPWLNAIAGGTPQFQAFWVTPNHFEAITPPGPAGEIMPLALTYIRPAMGSD